MSGCYRPRWYVPKPKTPLERLSQNNQQPKPNTKKVFRIKTSLWLVFGVDEGRKSIDVQASVKPAPSISSPHTLYPTLSNKVNPLANPDST